MSQIQFLSFNHVDPEDFLAIVNEETLRKHLIEHDVFTPTSIREWVNDKLKVDRLKGCRIRAVYIDNVLAGWCGIQPDKKGFELAIVISQGFWGHGISIFKTLMLWASELGHQEVLFHLLDSRREYKALKKMASRTHKTVLLGYCFTTYYIPVNLKQ